VASEVYLVRGAEKFGFEKMFYCPPESFAGGQISVYMGLNLYYTLGLNCVEVSLPYSKTGVGLFEPSRLYIAYWVRIDLPADD